MSWKQYKVWRTAPTNAPRPQRLFWKAKQWDKLSPNEQKAVLWKAEERRKESLSYGRGMPKFGEREQAEEMAVDPTQPLSRQVFIILNSEELFTGALAAYFYQHVIPMRIQSVKNHGELMSHEEFYAAERPAQRSRSR